MDEMEVVIVVARQKAIADELNKLKINIGKDSSDRKTSTYRNKRLQFIDSLWLEFEENHEKIKDVVKRDANYIIGNTRGKAEQLYKEIRRTLEAIAAEESENYSIGEPGTSKNAGAGERPKPKPVERSTPQLHAGSAPDAAKLIRRQRVISETLQRLLTSLREVNISTQSNSFCQVKVQAINKYWTQVEELHQDIGELTSDPSAIGYNLDEFIKLEDEVQRMVIQLSTKLEIPSEIKEPAVHSASSVLQLPTITIPKFDGDYAKWRQFSDLYSQMVHKQTLSNCQKMWYLKTNLGGEAEKLIRHFTLSDNNYSAAWKMLQDRYENRRLLVASLINKLLGQPCHASDPASATYIKSMHDTTQECLLGLENLEVSTSTWDPLLLHMLLKKLDRSTHTLYEQGLKNPKELQTLKEFLTFLETRFQSLEALGNKNKRSDDARNPIRTSSSLTSATATNIKCVACNQNHPLYQCQTFLNMAPLARSKLVSQERLCHNCLKRGHFASNCSLRGCKRCNKKHHTLLHIDDTRNLNATFKPDSALVKSGSVAEVKDSLTPKKPTTSTSFCNSAAKSCSTTTNVQEEGTNILLSTAIVQLKDCTGRKIDCRALLDSGSQINLITEGLAKTLGLQATPDAMCIEGIGQRKQESHRRLSVEVYSKINGFSARIEVHTLPKIISPQPSRPIKTSNWPIPNNIVLADPQFSQPGRIDMLIGAEIFYSTLAVGQIKLANDLPLLQNTVFGWTIAGKVSTTGSKIRASLCGICSNDEALDHQIEKFWHMEETPAATQNLTLAEQKCETHFTQTTRKDVDGRFIVRLPFIKDPTHLGESKDIAYQRLLSLERKLSKHEDLKSQYVQFMKEYCDLGHMKEINFNNVNAPYCFLPHHGVLKPDSSTTKLRVVFDASAKSSTNLSLNDVLATGPTIQDDLFSILLRFRMPRFAFTADIEKMYRQIRLDEAERKYQLIWWRNDPSEKVKCFQLNTVTYGTTSAPYLSTKCLQRLAEEQEDQYPLGSQVLRRDFYVDDVLTGSNSLQSAIVTKQELRQLLGSAGFKLRKWCANHPKLLEDIAQEDLETQLNFEADFEEHIKTVGLIWLPKSDEFCVKVPVERTHRVTKRSAYSDIARLFDPLGVLGPVVITAKIFLQHLWSLKLDWDAALPQDLHTTWLRYREGLRALRDLKFPRHLFAHRKPKSISYHIFADASERAYGAAVYVRLIDQDNLVIVRLICAKSRVAPTAKQAAKGQPIKQITIPRLELCAARLAAELGNRVKKDLNTGLNPMYFWSDSEIVLAWINTSPNSFQIFVANRILAIQRLTTPDQWRHVRSKENPADILSRGIAPEKLSSSTLWFHGPTFLHGSENIWPPPYLNNNTDYKEERKRVALTGTQSISHFMENINDRNSFHYLQRVVAYMLRFINRSRKRRQETPITISLTSLELEGALMVITRFVQAKGFAEDIKHLQCHGEVHKGSSLSTLSPFIGDDNTLRVGGRLESSLLAYDSKHPILLPYDSKYTKLLLKDIHERNHHAGPQTLLSIARQKFWPIKGKTLTRSIVNHCVQCSKANPKTFSQLMGNLPATRIQPARPFVNSGVDFCGPIWTHYKTRGKKPQKSYIAVFCCFATKAIHLEVVSDLTSDGFIGALKRFMGRRGLCRNIYCDNATNFVGAKNQLEELKEIFDSPDSVEKITRNCNTRGIDFHFIPPRSPHFGGLWEASVKSTKNLLKHTIASASLTYEELETTIIEIEAILNSRPITPITSNPNDLTALTPGHFLIGEPLTTSIDSSADQPRVSTLARWRLVKHLKEEFWRRWSLEYLNQLQHRYKWKTRCENATPGTMVIVKDKNLGPQKWQLGRIANTIKGEDGLVRVADVVIADEQGKVSTIRRAIHLLAPLPIETQQNPPRNESPDEQTARHQSSSSESANQKRSTHQTSASQIPSERKRQRLSLGSAVLTILLTCLALPSGHATPAQVNQFKSNPGIYFENLGLANIISSEWNLVVYYDMQPFFSEFATLNNFTQVLKTICNHLDDNTNCNLSTSNIQHLLKDLDTKNVLLRPVQRSKNKRGALNFIGNVANALFGVLDSEYADNMEFTIDNIQQNEDHLVHLIKNQTSLLDATYTMIKKIPKSSSKSGIIT